jgi:dTDP-4-amino-4,6-dideoxygalactose transaminase
VLADIEMDTFGPAAEEFARKTTGKTAVYLPVHFGGQACEIGQIVDLARARNLRVIEDAAHSFGATVGGTRLGAMGDVTAFSFYATKNLTCGEGGCLTTQSDEIADRFRMLSYHGMSSGSWNRHAEGGSWFYDVERLGFKFNMSDILSALGLSQLGRIDDLLAKRRAVAEKLAERLQGSPYFELPRTGKSNGHTWHLFVILLNLGAMSIDRDRFIRAMTAENIGCSVHFIPIYKHRFYEPLRDRSEGFPNCEAYFSRCVSLPIFPDMSDDDVDDIVSAMNRIAAHYSKSRHAD